MSGDGRGEQPPPHGRGWAPVVVIAAVLLGLLVGLAAFVVIRSLVGDDDLDGVASTDGSNRRLTTGSTSSIPAGEPTTASTASIPVTTNPASTDPGPPDTTVTTKAPPPPPPPPPTSLRRPSAQALTPVSATASSVLAPQRTRCTGETNTYGASNAIDGDLQTGWGTLENDGTGQRLTVDFGRTVTLTEASLVPGYAKVGPVSSAGCAPQSRWSKNRLVTAVRYRFDDGSIVDQRFTDVAVAQPVSLAVTTRTVTIEILGTVLPGGEGVDDDTIVSEVSFRGV